MAKKPASTIARARRKVKRKVSGRVTSHTGLTKKKVTKKKVTKKKVTKKKVTKKKVAKKKVTKKAAKKRTIPTKKTTKKATKKTAKKAAKRRKKKAARRVHAHRVRPGKKKRPEKKKRPWRRPIVFPPVTDKNILALDLERMATQIAQRITDKVIRSGHLIPDPIIPGHWKQTAESQILIALIEAEQFGTFNDALYDLAGEYEGYDTAGEIYSLWIYSGDD